MRRKWDREDPTDTFTISGPQNSSIHTFPTVQKSRSTDFETPKIVNVSVGESGVDDDGGSDQNRKASSQRRRKKKEKKGSKKE